MVVRTVQNATNQASPMREASGTASSSRPRPSQGCTVHKRHFVASRMDSIGRRGAAGVQAAAAVQEAPLAVYPLAQRQINSLFTAAINHLLQDVISGSKRTTSYLHATTHQQQHCAVALEPGDTWGKAIDRMGIENTQLLMYVKPVADPSDFCGEAVQGVNCAERCSVVTEEMEGSVGDCCDDEHQQARDSIHPEIPDLDVDRAYMNSSGLDVQYYGVVAQNISYPSGNGCYLLKTTLEKGNPACHCMHYSLMRVCESRALAEQTSNFWTREFR